MKLLLIKNCNKILIILKKISSNLKMIFLTKIKKIVTYGDKLMVLESDTSLNPNLAYNQFF